MLIIRREQLEVLSRASLRRFERELVQDLKACYPAQFGQVGEPGVLVLVRNAIRRGNQYGITTERDLATFAELDLSLGVPFERQKGLEWSSTLLRDPHLSPSARLALILARLPDA